MKRAKTLLWFVKVITSFCFLLSILRIFGPQTFAVFRRFLEMRHLKQMIVALRILSTSLEL
ncbi:MAG: hypothetical protein DMG96_28785 [Acidobacteria bacterium]|nr:MAG: hypothetical protein DMG96_28785 [Acidobacteriota bacterium]